MLRNIGMTLLVLTLCHSNLRAQVVLGAPITTPIQSAEFGLRTADFDTDGRLDLLARVGSLPALRFGDGRGHFANAALVEPQLPTDDMEAGDVDGDGRPDIVTIDAAPVGTEIRVRLGLGGLQFSAPPPIPVSAQPAFSAWLRLRDADGDGDLDVIARTDGLSFLARNDGAGHFVIHTLPLSGLLARFEAADFDGDGLADVTASFGTFFGLLTGTVFTQVLLGQPDGSLVPLAPWPQQKLLAVADLNGDGRLDVLTDAYLAGGAVVAHLGQAGGGFVDGPTSSTPGVVFASELEQRLGDFDSDGVLDLVAGFAVHLGDGAGGFATDKAVTFALSTSAAVHVADVVPDGRADLLWSPVGVGPNNFAILAQPNLTYPAGGPLLDLGHAKPGEKGWPILFVGGELQPGTATSFQISLGPPNAATILVAGLGQGLLPFHGGTLVPTPDVVLGPLVTNGQGSLLVQAHWPDLPSGSGFVVQGWMTKPGSPTQYAATTGVQITVP